MTRIEVTGLDPLIARMKAFPRQLQHAMRTTLEGSNLVLWESVPGYPEEPPESTYDRTGTLGRTLGVSESGGKQGQPDIYEVKASPGMYEAEFGTNLDYAGYVIGSAESQQAHQHQGRWWTLPETVVERALPKITRLWEIMTEELAKFLDGKGVP